MRTQHGRLTLISSAAVLAASIVGAPRAQAQASDELNIYTGVPVRQAGIKLSTWGSGEATQDTDHVFIGSTSIKIATHGAYQGARLELANPVDLKPALADKYAYLQFVVTLPNKNTQPTFGYPGFPGFGRGMGKFFGGQGRGAGGYPGGIGGPGGFNPSTQETGMTTPKPLSQVRVVLVTTDGKQIEFCLPIDSAASGRGDWSYLAIPVSAIPGLDKTNGEVKELRIFGDSAAVLYLGEVRVVRDETPIRVDDLPEYTVAKMDVVTFTASAEAGTTPLKYEWNFDAAHPGVDAEGKTVKHQYRKGQQDYKVTLTVSDVYGIKKPVTRTTTVHVTL